MSEQSCRMQPNSMRTRMWGPWETRGDDPAKLRALLVAAAVKRMGELESAAPALAIPFDEPTPPEQMPREVAELLGVIAPSVESTPNISGGDAVRQGEKDSRNTVVSFRRGFGNGDRGAKARKNRIDLLDVLGGDALPSPVAHGLLGDSQGLGEAGLGDSLGVPSEYGGEGAPGTVGHSAPLIQHDLCEHKRDLCASGGQSQQNAPMADLPRPELFSSFSAWIQALLQRPGVTQKKLALICGCSQQAVAAWKRGGKIKPQPLAKLAAWAGYDYQTVRMLVDDKPIPNTPRARAATRSRRDPEVEQIAAMLDVIADDEDGLRLARVLVQELVDQRQQLKKRRHA